MVNTKKNRKCTILLCTGKHYAGGFCHAHWLANRRYGSPHGIDPQAGTQAEYMLGLGKMLANAILNKSDEIDIEWHGCPFCNMLLKHTELCATKLAQEYLDRLQK